MNIRLNFSFYFIFRRISSRTSDELFNLGLRQILKFSPIHNDNILNFVYLSVIGEPVAYDIGKVASQRPKNSLSRKQ